MQKYSVNQILVNNLLSWVQTGAIAIPEIQRPFVWDSTKVRDLMDSLYCGYPIGYLISWKNPSVRLKDGSISDGKKVLIDGQQRVTALRAAILGESVIDKDYEERKIRISYNPTTESFATHTPAIEKDSSWIPDISVVLGNPGSVFDAVENYLEKNPNASRKDVQHNISKLVQINNRQIGHIELESDLDIDVVTEIFVRINSKGVVLSQADFAMSKIASYEEDADLGPNLRKAIDYFSHLYKTPDFYKKIEKNDAEFSKSVYFNKLSWLKNENGNLYNPDYADILRVAFTKEFVRGKLSDLVSLLSGRDFESRTFEKDIMDKSFKRLSLGVQDFINETNFQRFIMILKSAGFIDNSMVNSQNALNMAYAVFLKLREKRLPAEFIETMVQRWFVMSVLTSRYSSSPESSIDTDIKKISKVGVEEALTEIEASDLSDNFWKVTLVQDLERSMINTPALQVFFASQVKSNVKGFLSKDITVANMIDHKGDVHHLFPKSYLRKKYKDRGEYNQIANYVYTQSEINIRIGNKSPKEYFSEVLKQCEDKKAVYGRIVSKDEIIKNLDGHAIPLSIFDYDIDNYHTFLLERRKLMALKIKDYYKSLSGVSGSAENVNYLDIVKSGESEKVEFKAGLGWANKKDLGEYSLEYAVAKTVSAFLNTKGGKLFIGVSDNGEVLGIEQDVMQTGKKNHDSYLLRLNNIFKKHIGKNINQYLKLEIVGVDSKNICVVDVLPSTKPVFLKSGKDKLFYVRNSAETTPLDIEETNEFISNRWG